MERFYKVKVFYTDYAAQKVKVELQVRSLSTDYVTMLTTTCTGMDRAQEIAENWRNDSNCTDYAFTLEIDTRIGAA